MSFYDDLLRPDWLLDVFLTKPTKPAKLAFSQASSSTGSPTGSRRSESSSE
jgi:hypothetical protein